MKKVTETTFEYDEGTTDLVRQTTKEYIEYDENDSKILLDDDEDDGTIYESEINFNLFDELSKALALFTLGVSAVIAVKMLRRVSK